MLKRLVLCLTLLVIAATAPISAQTRGEVGVFAGWTFADGVSGDPFLAGDGNIYDRVDPKDSFGWGVDLGVLFGEGGEVGFIYGMQPSKLELDGTSTREVGDMSVTTYHGYFAYNFGPSDSPIRPYLLGGFGATNYGEVEFTTLAGVNRTIDSITKFSSTWGAGVKFYPSPNVGIRFGARWTPAYIKSDAEGWWCDPYWGCYLVGDPQYATLFDFNGGVTFRF
jgi:opacity protein-like surface antigen